MNYSYATSEQVFVISNPLVPPISAATNPDNNQRLHARAPNSHHSVLDRHHHDDDGT